MKFVNFLFIINWILILGGLTLYFISNNKYFLIFIVLGLVIISFSEYISLKKHDAINYQSLRVIFVYLIGAIFSLFVFIMSFIIK